MMLKTVSFSFLLLVSVTACGHVAPQGNAGHAALKELIIQPAGTTIGTRILPPAGYKRTNAPSGSKAHYLRTLPLKPDGAPVLYYDGRVKSNPNIYAAVLSMDIGHEDLQQCADAVIRLHCGVFIPNR